MFSPVLLKVPGQMIRCPCGFGAYEATHQGWQFLELEQFLPAVLSLSLHPLFGTHCQSMSSTRTPWQLLKSD